MAFFGLSDISFDKGPPSRIGPLGDLVKNEFKTTTLRYPLDVGNYDKGHYMVFYVRQQKNTKFKREPLNDDLINSGSGIAKGGISPQNALNDIQNSVANEINGALNKFTNSITSGINQITQSVGLGSISNPFGQSSISFGGNSSASQAVFDNKLKAITGGGLNFLRTTKLTSDAIALYMPDTLLYSHSQTYDQLSLGGELLGQIAAAGSSAIEKAIESGDAKSVGGILKGAAEGGMAAGKSAALYAGSQISASVGGQTGQAAFAALAGAVTNPMLEMIYRSPNFRTFQFDFMFYPRDEKEAFEVQRIVERFRFHQAPELLEGSRGFLVPPSEFDIRFYYGGNLNPNIPSIATCILTTIDLNYAPNGFATYEVPGENGPKLGRTGMPVAMQMTLQFQEVTYLTKSDFTSSDEFDQKSSLQRAESRDPTNIP